MKKSLVAFDQLPKGIPFEVDATHRHMSWIAAFIIYLSVLASTLAITLFSLVHYLAPAHVQELLLEIPTPACVYHHPEVSDEAKMEQEKKLEEHPAAKQDVGHEILAEDLPEPAHPNQADPFNKEEHAKDHLEAPSPAYCARLADSRDDAVVDVLEQQPGVVEVTQLSNFEMRRLLQPWFGKHTIAHEEHLPHVMRVTVYTQKEQHHESFNVHKTLQHVHAVAPGAKFSATNSWLGILENLAFRIQFLVAGLLVLFLFVAMGIVAFATRTNLLMQHHVISLLTLLGATDRFIAGRFERITFFVAMEALVKALVGVVLTVGCMGWLLYDAQQLQLAYVWWHLVSWRLLILPIVVVVVILLMIYSARRCVLRNLSKLF